MFPYKLDNYTPLFLFLYDNYYDNIINKDLARVICPSSAILRHEHSYIKEISINKVKDFFGPSSPSEKRWIICLFFSVYLSRQDLIFDMNSSTFSIQYFISCHLLFQILELALYKAYFRHIYIFLIAHSYTNCIFVDNKPTSVNLHVSLLY